MFQGQSFRDDPQGEEPLEDFTYVKIARRFSPAAGASFWALDQKVFENEFTLAAIQGTAATHASNLAISCGARRGFNSHDLVPSPAMRTIE